MAIRQNTNPHHLELHPELRDILMRNGMRATVTGSSNGFQLVVQGHDSPLLYYPISEKQLRALVDWGTNTANKRAYNTLASIVAADFDLPRDFVHARNANGRVAMGLHGNRIGVGEYGRVAMPVPMMHRHPFGRGFLGWTRVIRKAGTCAASEDSSGSRPGHLWLQSDLTEGRNRENFRPADTASIIKVRLKERHKEQFPNKMYLHR